MTEDERVADWRFFLPADQQNALVLGCGLGTVPVALAAEGRDVYAADVSWVSLDFIRVRRHAEGLDSLHPVRLGRDLTGDSLPFHRASFDLISLRATLRIPFVGMRLTKTAARLRGLLRPGGVLQLSLENRWSFLRMLRGEKDANRGFRPEGYDGYRQSLCRAGFAHVDVYAPLPHPEQSPLFYLPLEHRGALESTAQTVLSLVGTVSPEVKGAFGLEYSVAKRGAELAVRTRLLALARYMVPGFCVLAWNHRDQEMVGHAG